MLINFKTLYALVFFYFMLAVWTGIGNLSFAPSEVDSLIEAGLQPQSVNLDRPVVGGDPISTNIVVPSSESDWISFLYESATLQSHVWTGWAGAIRNFFLLGSGLFGLALIWDGVRTLTGFAGR